jgi:hypothetical protein
MMMHKNTCPSHVEFLPQPEKPSIRLYRSENPGDREQIINALVAALLKITYERYEAHRTDTPDE